MTNLRHFLTASVAAALLQLPALAAEPTDYQVTGPIVELTATFLR